MSLYQMRQCPSFNPFFTPTATVHSRPGIIIIRTASFHESLRNSFEPLSVPPSSPSLNNAFTLSFLEEYVETRFIVLVPVPLFSVAALAEDFKASLHVFTVHNGGSCVWYVHTVATAPPPSRLAAGGSARPGPHPLEG